LTADELKTFMAVESISIVELATIVGVTRRSIEHYRSGRYPVPTWLSLLLAAIRDKAIDLDWLADHVASRTINV
jgi:predicted transcriptional regulator